MGRSAVYLSGLNAAFRSFLTIGMTKCFDIGWFTQLNVPNPSIPKLFKLISQHNWIKNSLNENLLLHIDRRCGNSADDPDCFQLRPENRNMGQLVNRRPFWLFTIQNAGNDKEEQTKKCEITVNHVLQFTAARNTIYTKFCWNDAGAYAQNTALARRTAHNRQHAHGATYCHCLVDNYYCEEQISWARRKAACPPTPQDEIFKSNTSSNSSESLESLLPRYSRLPYFRSPGFF